MFQKLLDMYAGNRINEVYLAKAVKLGWITEEDMQEIVDFKSNIDSFKREGK